MWIPHPPVCNTQLPCSIVGGLASDAGGARNHAEWAWLTESRVVQFGRTPLHIAAQEGQTAAIKALVAAKADVHAKDSVRGGCWEGERGGGVWSVFYCGCLEF